MRGQLTREKRLEISVTKLKNSVGSLRRENQELKAVIKTQSQEITALKEQLTNKESQRKQLLSYLYKENTSSTQDKKLGKKDGAKGYQRPLPTEEEVTEEKVFSLKKCPHCKSPVGKALDTVIKYQEDINLKPDKITTRYIITRHWCGKCEAFVKMRDVPEIPRIGLKTMAYVLYARYRLRLPINLIQQSLLDLHDFKISEGEIINELHKAKTLFTQDYETIIELIKNADTVYCDETGWRVKGQNWWIWVFSTEEGVRYVVEDTRGKGVAADALGEKQDRVLVSDFYAAYKNLPGSKQKCWVHLLRDSKHISGQMHEDLKQTYHVLLEELKKKKEQRACDALKQKLLLIEQKRYKEQETQKLQERISRYRDELLTCIAYDGVLPENNTAERALRPMVVMRKIFGGSRSLQGAKTHEVNTSVIETKLKQNPHFFDVIVPLLAERFQSGE